MGATTQYTISENGFLIRGLRISSSFSIFMPDIRASKSMVPILYIEPPLLVQRCNDTTAGLGYLEVNVICPCKISPLGG